MKMFMLLFSKQIIKNKYSNKNPKAFLNHVTTTNYNENSELDLENIKLHEIKNYLKQFLFFSKRREIIESLCILNNENFCEKKVLGLQSSLFGEKFIIEFFTKYIQGFEKYYIEQADLKLFNVPFSLKIINGINDIALNWNKSSKNKANIFSENILLINKKTCINWKNGPLKANNNYEKKYYTDKIYVGIYFINKYSLNNIKFSKNNKSDSVIKKIHVYEMLKNAKDNGLFIKLPDAIGNFYEVPKILNILKKNKT